ncbi:MAG: DnaJ domain-containing protein, partial [Proteobacteria bacterium]|nr:DnaJ domain-containing protein [Pseudomonadota bacterium]
SARGRAIISGLMIAALAVLTLTGRFHWLTAVAAATIIGLPILVRRFLNNSATSNSPPPAADSMEKQEARQILGLGDMPTQKEIIEAHRKLMMKLHPDKGGTTYLAQQLNEAKRILLKP